MLMVLSSWQKRSPGSCGECKLSARWPPTLRPSQPTWAVSPDYKSTRTQVKSYRGQVVPAPGSTRTHTYSNSFCITFTCYVSCLGCLHDHCPPVGCYHPHHHCHLLLLLRPKADIYFTVSRRVEGEVRSKICKEGWRFFMKIIA